MPSIQRNVYWFKKERHSVLAKDILRKGTRVLSRTWECADIRVNTVRCNRTSYERRIWHLCKDARWTRPCALVVTQHLFAGEVCPATESTRDGSATHHLPFAYPRHVIWKDDAQTSRRESCNTTATQSKPYTSVWTRSSHRTARHNSRETIHAYAYDWLTKTWLAINRELFWGLWNWQRCEKHEG